MIFIQGPFESCGELRLIVQRCLTYLEEKAELTYFKEPLKKSWERKVFDRNQQENCEKLLNLNVIKKNKSTSDLKKSVI